MSAANALASLTAPGRPCGLVEVRITDMASDGSYVLADGRTAAVACSCLLKPQVGDLVLATDAPGVAWLLAVLTREAGGTARLSVPGADEVRLEQDRVSLVARQLLALTSQGDAQITALATLRQYAGDQFVHVARALVETLDQHLSRARLVSVEASDLMSISGGHTLLSAAGELRADAERICLG
ncbi:MAG: DUF3540 domain-containing protein [Rhodocyclaceae bacterium]|nr:DUF3540 domain-containing protein [Rhodocyclaceae bacterium]MBX3668282.1 DUF3540 domain-containing protein [Rhodocyclaceae bacterium]